MQDYGIPKKEEEPEVVPLNEMFTAYCRLDPLFDATEAPSIPLSQSDKWLTAARILDMRTVTTTDTGLYFFEFRKRAISFEEYLIYLKNLAKMKKLNLEEMTFKMQRCSKPTHPHDIMVKKR